LVCRASWVSETPVLVWSGEARASPHQIRGYYSTEAIGHFLESYWRPTEYQGALPHLSRRPGLVVLFLVSALSSEELALHNDLAPTLAEAMKSHSSFYLPYVTTSSPILPSISRTFNAVLKSGADIYYHGPESFLSNLDEHTKISKITALADIAPSSGNSKTDFLLVYIDGESTEKEIELLDLKIKELKDSFITGFSNYVVVLTGAESSLQSVLPSFEEMGIPEEIKRAVLAPFLVADSNGSSPPPIYNGRNTFNVYFNGTFWELFFVLLFFWGIIIFGLKQLLQLQAPDRIPNADVKKKKH